MTWASIVDFLAYMLNSTEDYQAAKAERQAQWELEDARHHYDQGLSYSDSQHFSRMHFDKLTRVNQQLDTMLKMLATDVGMDVMTFADANKQWNLLDIETLKKRLMDEADFAKIHRETVFNVQIRLAAKEAAHELNRRLGQDNPEPKPGRVSAEDSATPKHHKRTATNPPE